MTNFEKRVWTQSEAESWLKDNDFKYTGNVGGIEIPEVMANWYAYRQENPDKYDSFRNDLSPFGFDEEDGVMAVYGLYDDEDKGSEVQSIRFYHGKGESEENDAEEEELDKQCPNCGRWVHEDEEICPECGYEFDLTSKLENIGESEVVFTKHWASGNLDMDDYHYDLFFSDIQFVLNDNITKKDKVSCSKRKPYKVNFAETLEDKFTLIPTNQVGSMSKDKPSWVKTLFRKKCEVYKSDNCYALKYDDKVICLKEDDDKNMWSGRIINYDDCCDYKEYIQFSTDSKQVEMNFESLTIDVDFIEKDSDGNYIAKGNIISEGAWNGVYFPKEVLKELSAEHMEKISVDVGKTHKDKIEDVGEILSIQYKDGEKGWYIETRIEDEDAKELIDDMETPGFSIETKLLIDTDRRIVEKVKEISSVVIVPNPACKVCYIE